MEREEIFRLKKIKEKKEEEEKAERKREEMFDGTTEA
jgi:hypothetical protein